ncbi:ABC transporter transmembrane domain-containing protein [Agilicoccus flavus]|uniref:ABC transporter transmembrane domain-containing protein n=1 Tax=Agilicoccus flavus TaxID=2775968 RepID=UPI001CF71B38|nr:ABC transporter ATP-binding protein [Agilicoccus flavus]
MRDFPSPTRAYLDPGAPAPDTRSPGAFVRWLFRVQITIWPLSVVFALLWVVPPTLTPWLLGKAIDTGIVPGDPAQTWRWLGWLALVTVVGALAGVANHTLIVRSWVLAIFDTVSLVTNKTLHLGHVLPRRTPTGEVLSIAGADGDEYGGFMEVAIRAAAEFAAYVVVASIVLSTSFELGLLVLLAAPVLAASAWPFLRPMEKWQGAERSRTSHLTSQATDIVAGLRVLRGIGGESTFGANYAAQSQRVRRAGVRAGAWEAAVEATGVLLAGLLVVGIVRLGVAEVGAGRLEIGQLVAFLGYGLFLVQPMRTFFQLVQKWTRTRVAARKTTAVLGQEEPWRAPERARVLPVDGDLVDEEGGITARGGRLTMLVCGSTDEAAALADRLGRYLPADGDDAVSVEVTEGVVGRAARAQRARAEAERARRARRDAERAARPWGVSLGGIDLSSADLADVRATILVGDASAQLFAGTLQEAVEPHGRLTRPQAEAALLAAAALDVYDALPGGWAGRLDERARGLSGGQRQRLVLARALAADAPVLVLVEPTSAVDAHTEAAIGERLPAARAGRTTVVATTSPLLLRHADDVVLVRDGRAVTRGTHAHLMATSPDYRAVVVRDEQPADAGGPR